MTIKTKLYLGFITIIIMMLLFCISFFYIYYQQNSSFSQVVTENYRKASLAYDIKYITESTATELRELLLTDPADITEEQLDELRELGRDASVILDSLQQLSNENSMELIASLNYLNGEYRNRVDFIIQYFLDYSQEEIQVHSSIVEQEIIEVNNEVRQNLLKGIVELIEFEEQNMNVSLAESDEAFQNTLMIFVILLIIGIIVIVGVTSSITRSINRNIDRVRNVMSRLPEYSFDKLPRIEVKRKDEIGEIAQAYNHMADSLEEMTEKEKKLNESLKEDNWIKTNYAEVAESLQGVEDLPRFEALFLEKIAPKVDAIYGVFYLREEGNVLRKQAGYAADGDMKGKETIEIGEGLLGQCAANKKLLHLNNLPADYIHSSSGLGEGELTSLIIIPILFEREVIGVLELAKYERFTPLQIQLLEQVSDSIGISINQILNHIKISDLLAESQMAAEELQSQSEELQQQQEELKSTNEKLQEQYRQSDDKTKELEKIRQDLEEKNRNIELSSKYKSEFLANMSHELRTPLNSILILSQLLYENEKGTLTKNQVEHAETIYTSGKDLLELINDILDLSKIESGKMEIYKEEVTVEDIKAFVDRQFTPIAKQKELQFHINVAANTKSSIITDDQRLKQIIKNLLSNAFKFTHKGSVTFSIREETAGMVFTVSDTGIGISEDQRKAIFEAFYQGDGTTTRKYGGTGLGLSITRELAQLLNGKINVESKEGEGSIFQLILPLDGEHHFFNENEVAATAETVIGPPLPDQQEDTIHKNEPIVSEPLHGKEVLIVDDDMRNVFALTSALEKYEMKVRFAENGKEAIEMLLENPSVDIVLMDIMMPVMDGYEAMRGIRSIDALKDLPVIALTAKAMKNDKSKCLEAGASDYISKPVDMDQLVSLLKVWVYQLEGE